ncbi:hypothetical protein L3X38_034498 [Prunus dulcis]|uniref:Uncharacterized protein n=1 Tax=Prunus dulcis TaxID=3755 RepID=A0AAD4VHW6_PRUDU|nr:hypothetical protein L3X38_034498 [Prunus dulcis]
MSEAGVTSDATALAAARFVMRLLVIQKNGYTNGEIRIRPELHLHPLSHPRRLHQNLHQVHLAPRPWPPQGKSSIFAKDTQNQIIQIQQNFSKQPTAVVQQDQESQGLEILNSGLDIFPHTTSTTIPPPVMQSGPEDSPQVTEHSNSNSSTLPSSHIGNTSYQLPSRITRGIPRQQYDPNPKAKVKYHIANNVSLHRLSSSYPSFVCQLSTVFIPSTVEEALKDPKWT